MFKIADPFSASATFLYRPEHFLAVSFFLEIYTPCRKKIKDLRYNPKIDEQYFWDLEDGLLI